MEYKLRGWVEKSLDEFTEPEFIDKIVDVSRRFPVKNLEEFCFAFIVGQINAGSQAQVNFFFERDWTREEFNEVMDIVERRTTEIKGKIRLALGR